MRILHIFVLLLPLISACSKPEKISDVQETFVLSDKMLSTTETAKVTQSKIRSELSLYGKITTDNNKMIEVYPVVGGYVTKVLVELGDYVEKGQLLATIRSTEVAEFEKELEDAKNDKIVATNNYRIAQELFEGKLNSERDVIVAQSELDKANSQLRRIQETYKIYNIKSGAIYEVRSPISGFVIEKKINQDMLLRNDRSDNIFDIAEIDDVWAIANVNESDINEVRLGFDGEVTTLSYPDKKFFGKIDKIFNVIDPETKAMKVRIKLSNPGYLLKPEMRSKIRLFHTEDASMLAVPSTSIVFDKSKHFVMIFKDRNNIETRQVEVFREVDGISYISKGVSDGELVMTSNQLLVYDALND